MERDFKEIGCIIIPKETPKEDFINYCFNKERFWVLTNRMGMLANVPCVHQVIQDLKFADDDSGLGSQVIVEYIGAYKQYIITGTLSKVGESSYNSEESLLLYKTIQNGDNRGNTVGIIGNSLLSKLSIFAKNVKKKTAKLLIECFGSKDSELKLGSSGWVLIQGDSGIKLRYKTEKEIVILEDKIELFYSKEQKLTISNKELCYVDGTNTFKIDSSGYNLGKINFKDYINEILDFLGNDLMLLTPMGPTSPGTMASTAAPKLTQLKTKLAQINS